MVERSSVCVVDTSGQIVREGKVASEPQALIAWFGALGLQLARIELEAGPLSQWQYAPMRQGGTCSGAFWRRGTCTTPSRRCR
jgi:hypothetical protein